MSIKNELEKSIPATIKLTEKEKTAIRYRVHQSSSSKMQLKPMVVSVLSVVILVILIFPAIRSLEKEQHISHQIMLTNTNDSSSLIPVSEEQKKQYYEQYVRIVEWAMAQKAGISIGVSSMEEFKESDWVEPKEFEERIRNIVDGHLATEREKISAMSTTSNQAVTNRDGSTTKTTYIYFSDMLKAIEVTGNFNTKYSTDHNRHLFVAADNISTALASSQGTWEQKSYQASLLDGGRSYSIRIEGIFELNNIAIEKAFTIEFSCDEDGGIY